MHFITKTHISLTSWVLNTFLFPYDSKWTAQHIYPQILSWVFVVESHRWDSVGKKKKKESKRELKTAPCLTGLLFWVIDGNKLKCNFSFSIWREIIFWILKFWQEAAVKMACQSNDFLSSYSSVKGKILFLLIFNFYSFPADLYIFFPFWLFFFYSSSEVLTFFPGTKPRFFSCDRTVQLSVLATQPAFLFVCSSILAGDGVSKSRASFPRSSFETISAKAEAVEFEQIWQATFPS